MRTGQATIRLADERDIRGICELEERVWSRRAVTPLSSDTVRGWLDAHAEGLLVGEHGSRIRGYGYFEFLPYALEDLGPDWPPARKLADKSLHRPDGTLMYGVSAIADLPGLGRQLFARALKIGKERGRHHAATLLRMQGLARFIRELRKKGERTCNHADEQMALWYAARCIRQEGGSVAFGLEREHPPESFPERIRKDPVLTYPASETCMTLQAIVPSAFKDAESADLAALVSMPCTI